MKGLPLNTDMARAWHEGRKSVTRRRVKLRAHPHGREWHAPWHRGGGVWCFTAGWGLSIMGLDVMSPYQPGEVVYIQEPWGVEKGRYIQPSSPYGGKFEDEIFYRADDPNLPGMKWRSPITMPEWASRSKARIVDVRPERVREITHEEAIAEGAAFMPEAEPRYEALSVPQIVFAGYWDSLHPGSWDRDDWVWRYGLERVDE